MIDHPKSFLLVPATGIGDTIQFTPVISNLHLRFPNSELSVITGSSAAAQIIAGAPGLREILVLEKRYHDTWLSMCLKLRWSIGSFDTILAAAGIPAFCPIILGSRLVVSFQERSRIDRSQKREYVTLARNLSLNEVEENLRLLEPFDCRELDPRVRVFYSDEDHQFADRLWVRHHLKDRSPVFSVHTRCATPQKEWGNTSFALLLRKLLDFYPHSAVLILGGPGEDVDALCEFLDAPDRCIDLAGQTTISQTAAVVRKCQLVISNDSAVAHVAAAVGTPVVTLFGPSDPRRVKPWNPNGLVRVVSAGLECSPCYLLYSGLIHCRYGNDDIRCMNSLTPEAIFQNVRETLEESGDIAAQEEREAGPLKTRLEL